MAGLRDEVMGRGLRLLHGAPAQEAAFSRAFKRLMGVSPAAWGRARAGAASPA